MKEKNLVRADSCVKIAYPSRLAMYRRWVEMLRPFHGLQKRQQDVMALLLLKRDELSRRTDDEELINERLFSPSMKQEVAEACKMKKAQLYLALQRMEKVGVIKDGTLNKRFIPRFDNGHPTFNFVICFDLTQLKDEG